MEIYQVKAIVNGHVALKCSNCFEVFDAPLDVCPHDVRYGYGVCPECLKVVKSRINKISSQAKAYKSQAFRQRIKLKQMQ